MTMEDREELLKEVLTLPKDQQNIVFGMIQMAVALNSVQKGA